jgi:hypothetical protein
MVLLYLPKKITDKTNLFRLYAECFCALLYACDFERLAGFLMCCLCVFEKHAGFDPKARLLLSKSPPAILKSRRAF